MMHFLAGAAVIFGAAYAIAFLTIRADARTRRPVPVRVNPADHPR